MKQRGRGDSSRASSSKREGKKKKTTVKLPIHKDRHVQDQGLFTPSVLVGLIKVETTYDCTEFNKLRVRCPTKPTEHLLHCTVHSFFLPFFHHDCFKNFHLKMPGELGPVARHHMAVSYRIYPCPDN